MRHSIGCSAFSQVGCSQVSLGYKGVMETMHNRVCQHGDFDDPWAYLGNDKGMTGKRPILKDRILVTKSFLC